MKSTSTLAAKIEEDLSRIAAENKKLRRLTAEGKEEKSRVPRRSESAENKKLRKDVEKFENHPRGGPEMPQEEERPPLR
jgi:hypothetical protein